MASVVKAYLAEEFEKINLARGNLIQKVKQYVRMYRTSADPDAFLRCGAPPHNCAWTISRQDGPDRLGSW